MHDHPTSLSTPERPREIERHIARRIKRLDDVALMKILEQLRYLAIKATTKEASHV